LAEGFEQRAVFGEFGSVEGRGERFGVLGGKGEAGLDCALAFVSPKTA